MTKATSKPGDIITTEIERIGVRPLIVTSVNKDGTVNGTVFLEPGDLAAWGANPFHLSNVKV